MSPASLRSNDSSETAQLYRYGSGLFSYDQRATSNEILLTGEDVTSQVEYDEYVVYGVASNQEKNDESQESAASSSAQATTTGNRITHRFSQDHTLGAAMVDLAFRRGHKLNRNGSFQASDNESEMGVESNDMLARVRRVVCFRLNSPIEGAPEQLSMCAQDLADLNLHPATLQYATRVATESRFWSKDNSVLSLILSFSDTPQTPCDFLSMTYNVHTRSATILIRQSWAPRRHIMDSLDEYDHRLESCREHWAHPLIMPVILLQVDFNRCEEAVAANTLDVIALEEEVVGASRPDDMRSKRQQHQDENRDKKPAYYTALNMTELMKRSHEVLRGTIKLLDTIRWMERAVKVLILSGDELSDTVHGAGYASSVRDLNLGGDRFGDYERQPSPLPTLHIPGQDHDTSGFHRTSFPSSTDELGTHWHEIRQYLEGLLRLSMSLETERRMAEARCRAQIDIIYSRMAQEDNALNARMAVASTRDSSSMKALAVITAIFLPGEFIGTLFGMSMFDWLAPSKDESDVPQGMEPESDDILSKQFWVYWTISIPLTMVILLMWRAWWVHQDRYFRRHLSRDLSEERFWTDDGKPRVLEQSFIHDLVYLSARRDEKAHHPSIPAVKIDRESEELGNGLPQVQTWPVSMRRRGLSNAAPTVSKYHPAYR